MTRRKQTSANKPIQGQTSLLCELPFSSMHLSLHLVAQSCNAPVQNLASTAVGIKSPSIRLLHPLSQFLSNILNKCLNLTELKKKTKNKQTKSHLFIANKSAWNKMVFRSFPARLYSSCTFSLFSFFLHVFMFLSWPPHRQTMLRVRPRPDARFTEVKTAMLG